MLFDAFDEIRIINLSHRADRRREMTAEFKRLGHAIDGQKIAFFDAIKTSELGGFYSSGAHGCYQSHLLLLERAKGSILILEDDCQFTQFASTATVPECEIFYGGYNALDPADLQRSDIMGAHMMGYFKPNAAASYLRRVLEDAEFRGNVPPPPFDGAIVWYRRAHPEVITAFATEQLANQRPSRTDIGQPRWIDRLPALARVARKLRTMLKA